MPSSCAVSTVQVKPFFDEAAPLSGEQMMAANPYRPWPARITSIIDLTETEKLFEFRLIDDAKLISGVLRYRMPIEQVIKLVGSLQLNSESINTWKNGVERALKKYIQDGTEAKGKKCPNCGNETLVYQEGCLICTTCGASRCG